MNKMQLLKKNLRNEIKERKQQYSKEELIDLSKRVTDLLRCEPVLAKSEVVLLYHSLPDEVFTHEIINQLQNRWRQIVLPVVVGDELELRLYTGEQDLKQGAFGILEPCGKLFTNYTDIDLVVVPGVAFDRRGNRLGRGKGYYDKLLPHIDAYKMGICFPFQYLKEEIIPTEETDVPMNKVLTASL